MADYKELYFRLFSATEQAIRILIEAQQDCEEAVISAPETVLTVLQSQTPEREDAVFNAENPDRP